MSAPLIHAGTVEHLLRQKHAEDVFVPECKTGPSQSSSHRRLDAWVMKKSYSPFCCVGYEIKVSRQDFIGDTKLTEYLPYCHQFYLVAPDGVISAGEIPPEAGLMKVTKNGKRLLTVKKAPFRQVTIPPSLLVYVLMSRAEISATTYGHTNNLELYRKFTEQRVDKRSVGRFASRKIAKYVSDLCVERDNAIRRANSADAAIKAFESVGLDITQIGTWNLAARAEEIATGISEQLIKKLEDVAYDTRLLAENLRKRKQEALT